MGRKLWAVLLLFCFMPLAILAQSTKATGEFHISCGPISGAELVFRLLRFHPQTDAREIRFDLGVNVLLKTSLQADVEAWRCFSADKCEKSLKAQVYFSRVSNKKVSGRYTMTFQNGEKETGLFILKRSDYKKQMPVCE
jgi:hypothetical protein